MSIPRPTTIAELESYVGQEFGPTQWLEVTQDAINAFAEVTGDAQWIHVDQERAAASPFGGTIAHGLYTLSLGPALMEELTAFDGFAHSLNYGYEKVRFPAPLPVGARIRMRAVVDHVDRIGEDSAHIVTVQTFECEGLPKPVCVAHAAARFTQHPRTN